MLPQEAWWAHLDEAEQALYWNSSRGTVRSQPAHRFFQRLSEFISPLAAN